jgi:hypothetical protein
MELKYRQHRWTRNISVNVTSVLSMCLFAIGGAILAVYTMSVWPFMLDRLSACPPARTWALAAVVWLIEILYSVWTVAYNFVPGGEYTREHTGWLIIVVTMSLGLATLTGIYLLSIKPSKFDDGLHNRDMVGVQCSIDNWCK